MTPVAEHNMLIVGVPYFDLGGFTYADNKQKNKEIATYFHIFVQYSVLLVFLFFLLQHCTFQSISYSNILL